MLPGKSPTLTPVRLAANRHRGQKSIEAGTAKKYQK
jgi:hypothetical protein